MTDDKPNLTKQQRRRVAALRAARDVLTERSAAEITASDESAPDVIDLYHVAHYIVTGEDPWGAPITQEGN